MSCKWGDPLQNAQTYFRCEPGSLPCVARVASWYRKCCRCDRKSAPNRSGRPARTLPAGAAGAGHPFLLASEADEVRREAAQSLDTVAALAVGLPSEPLSGGRDGADPLKARILGTLAGRPKTRAALLVIDMQNDNLRAGSTVEVPRARDIVPAVVARLDAARSAGVPVVYVIDQHAADDPDLDAWTTHNVIGSPGQSWPPLAPKPGDRLVTKSTYSAFTGRARRRA